MSDIVEGGCLCGSIRYRVAAGPKISAACWCRTCRRASAAPIVPWLHIPVSSLEVTSGKPVEYRSSPDVVRTFCGRCGTPITYCKAGYDGMIDVTTSSLDDPDAFPPMLHTWTSHALSWFKVDDGIPMLPEGAD
jgi:hypothetical protein